jgi:transposase-like protein
MGRSPKRKPLSAAEKRQLVGRLLGEGKSYRVIASDLGLTKSTVAYHARRLGLPVDEKASRRYDWGEIQRAYDAGLTVRQCAKKFGFNLASWHGAVKRGAVVPRPVEMPIELLLVVGRTATNRSHLKSRLLKEGIKQNRCEACGITHWRGRPLNMQLHHKNGDGLDKPIGEPRVSMPELPFPDRHVRRAERSPT